ncbi:MAG: DNA-binding domain-containing protein [Pseudomonadota bacterium]
MREIKLDKQNNSLATLQKGFADALLNVDLAGQTLSIFAAPESPLEARLAFYRGNQSAIWTSALANAYPVLLKLVGVDFFEQMARAYGLAFPSHLGDLNHFGADLAAFLADAPVNKEYPYFADVAALEWQVHRAYYAADADFLTLPSFIAGASEKLHDARLIWHPAAQLFESSSASIAVWLSHQDDHNENAPFDLTERNYGLITRYVWQVSVLAMSKADFCALQALSQGENLAAALEVAIDSDPNFDVASALNAWFAARTFSNYEIL